MALLGNASRQARLREWQEQLRLRTRLEARFQRQLAREFRRIARDAAEGFETGRTEGALLALRDHQGTLLRLGEQQYRTAFDLFGGRLRDEVKGLGLTETTDFDGVFALAIERWLKAHGARLVQIGETTKRRILRAILDGESENETIPQIAKRIRQKTGGVIAAARSLVIARTETHAAAVAASDEAVRALDIDAELQREWIAAIDNRTRETHIDANGQIRGMAEPFEVGAADLIRPGDPAGPAAEVIHCRCVLGYVTPDF
jgi:hypothetical protein